jgi:hypothetical protein
MSGFKNEKNTEDLLSESTAPAKQKAKPSSKSSNKVAPLTEAV